MASCSCNDWGPDTLGPDGKWICDQCGGSCFCDKIWESGTDIPLKEILEESGQQTNKEQKISNKNENSCKLVQPDVFQKCEACICGPSMKNEIQKTLIEMKKPSKKDVSVLYDPQFGSSMMKDTRVDSDDRIFSSQDSTKNETRMKFPRGEVQVGGSKMIPAKCVKRGKCKDCKCTHDVKGIKIKTGECQAASDRKKKSMETYHKIPKKYEDLDHRDVENELKESVKAKKSHSEGNFHFHSNDDSEVLIFLKRGKCRVIECKSSDMVLLRSLKNSNELRGCGGMKGKSEERKDQQISKFVPTQSKPSLKKFCTESTAQKEGRGYDKPERPLKFSEIAGSGTIEKNVPLIKSGYGRVRCEKLRIPDNRSEEVEMRYTNLGSSSKQTKIAEPVTNEKCDEPPIPIPLRTSRRKRLQTERMQHSSNRPAENSERTERRISDRNLQSNECNYCKPATSIEKLCPCGCGYFIEGASETRSGSYNNPSKNACREGTSDSKRHISKSRKHDCEGAFDRGCELCCQFN